MNNKIFKLFNLRLLIIFILFAFSINSLSISNTIKAQTNTNTSSSSLNDTTYKNIQSFTGANSTTTINNSDTKGLGDVANMILTIMVIVIVGLVVFRILQGAITKGTFDNIYDQQQGNKTIKNAGTALLVFILAYAVLSFINPDLTYWTFIDRVAVDTYESLTGGNNGSNLDCNVKGYTSTNILDMLKQDEGVFNTAYTDSLGIPSIGVGFNLTRSDAKKQLLAVGVSESDATKLTSLKTNQFPVNKKNISPIEITNDQINKLLTLDIGSHKNNYAIPFTEKAGKDFSKLPENIQLVLLDMSFMGDYTDFVNMNAALAKDDYINVGKEIINSKYCGQVGDRCVRLAELAGAKCSVTSSIITSVAGSAAERCKIASKIKDSDLKPIDDAGHKLLINRANQFLAMKAAAAKDGITLKVSSGPNSAYRSDQSQIDTCKTVCAGNKPACPSGPGPKCATACSLGGNGSNHVTGDAIDLENGCHNNTVCNFSSPVAKWMNLHGKDYGFINNLPTDGVHYSSTGN